MSNPSLEDIVAGVVVRLHSAVQNTDCPVYIEPTHMIHIFCRGSAYFAAVVSK